MTGVRHSGFILGVDLDGVCGDYTAAFRAAVAADRGVAPEALPEQTNWDFAEWGLSEEDFYRVHQRAVLEQRMFRTMPLIAGAAEALWRLSDAGVWIRIITHRLHLNWSHAVTVQDTVSWLDTHGIPYRDLCFLGDKPQVEADCYVDDAPHNVVALRESGAYVVVFDQPYNRDLDGPRARDWRELEQVVGERMAALGRAHQPALPGIDDARHRVLGRVREPGA